MYELILKAPLRFPNFVPPEAQSLLRGLLEREEFKRLGAGPTDAAEIKSHPFFADIDWEKLHRRELTPPFIPVIGEGESDTKVGFHSACPVPQRNTHSRNYLIFSSLMRSLHRNV